MVANKEPVDPQRLEVYESLLSDIKSYITQEANAKLAKRFDDLVRYNVDKRPLKFTPKEVEKIFRDLTTDEQQTSENIRLAHILNWCVDALQGSYSLADDIIDHSTTRYGAPCWYKREEVQMDAVNDAYLLETAVGYIMEKYFRHTSFYVQLLELTRDCKFKSAIGQGMDLELTKEDISGFRMENFNLLTKLKAEPLLVGLPWELAMCLAGITDQQSFRQLKSISVLFGELHMAQNDFIDCYADSKKAGKEMNDIQEGKGTWLAAKFNEKATPEQRQLFKQNYGHQDPEKVAKVKELYAQVNMEQEYEQYKHEMSEKIKTALKDISNERLQKALSIFLEEFHSTNLYTLVV